MPLRALHRLVATAALGLLPIACAAQQDHAYFGGLHSHTSYSDGSGYPDEAFAHARAAGCDFFAITEHNHNVDIYPKEPRKGQPPVGGDHSLYGVFGEVPHGSQAHPTLIAAANAATVNGSFVAIYGQEFSSLSSGNHACVFDIPQVIDVPNGSYKDLVAWIKDPTHLDSTGQPAILQFNHPNSTYRAQHIEYGMDDFGTDDNWIAEMGALARTIEVLNGPGTFDVPHHVLPPSNQSDYEYYLSRGFHLAPSADQDNHYKTWGDYTTARTGVIAQTLTRPAILNAIRARHVYATTDPNLTIIATINGSLCGDIVNPPAPDSALHIEIKLADKDEPHAAYTIDIMSGVSGDLKIAQKKDVIAADGDGTYTFDEVHFEGPKQYIFFKVHQTNEDGVEDVAWTAPVWFEVTTTPPPTPAAQFFMASKHSAVYHTNPNCPACKSIKAENRVTGDEARNGRTPHNCPPE